VARKDPTPATLKALFAKSGNRCAFSKCTNALVDDLNIFVGEVCHIHAIRKKDARYDPSKSDDELRHFDNLMLMCHAHHRRIDSRADLYSADMLREMKLEHETLCASEDFTADDSVVVQAALQIVQEDWSPYLDSAIELLYETLQDEHVTQGKMNYVSANVATINDAQLFVAYTKLFQTLSPAGQIDLYREQEQWRTARRAYAESQVESHGGSLARLERNEAFSEFTKKRIEELAVRIKDGSQTGDL
jgi:uncharacterized protein YecT (DUF1311 family)